MENYLIYSVLFLLGFIEEFVAVIYYATIRKSLKIPAAVMSMIRNSIWIIASAGIFSSFLNPTDLTQSTLESIIRAIIHTIGVGIGNYISLNYEERIHNKIFKLARRKGKKKYWWVLSDKKK